MITRHRQSHVVILTMLLASAISCNSDGDTEEDVSLLNRQVAVSETFGGRIDLDNLEDYANQAYPNYIREDNTGTNVITNAGATLGRVLFYDKKMSIDNTVSCASCHQQAFAFSDPEVASAGVNGTTGRHSMRLVNSRFAEEERFFWDERAQTLEAQTTQPIQDHIEMGFSGSDGDPGIEDLIVKLSLESYYTELFTLAFGDPEITEDRMQQALAQFVRSIQSFDSPFDEGMAQVRNINDDFPNFSSLENLGKTLFLRPPDDGGAGCQGCHRAPEFDIDPDTRNNGVISSLDGTGDLELEITRAPSLRDLINPEGELNGPLMHNGAFADLASVIEHYDRIENNASNTNLDRRLGGGNRMQNLQLSDEEKEALVAFLETLTGSSIYSDLKYSDPF
ncbi:MAG: cytochrome c peroxidase [Bacteroidota bacterium]